ncbi:phosphatidate phosphatase LPIN3 isoform X3 [Drosophila innubila]|uniref:phosphatidate phosphatase LPIN3 isoform X3 n=1 Tax=Drosophila innubila TaxID=198719 RepID=UPI00148DFBC4|nr:phosphatidate phosphatase LPIN3 isoform X3 [Drosophila innubila]
MNSLVRVFSNLQDFYNDINAATLTGAIDVIAVEQEDGEYQCSPFHVRFGKLGVLRSREKVVDIEINGAPVDIQMKLGDSGEAFFVEECPEDDDEELPENLATSPIPKSFLQSLNKGNDTMEDISGVIADKNASDDLQIPLPMPRRNSIDLSKEEPKEIANEGTKYENQVSDYTQRRHTENEMDARRLGHKRLEYTTLKMRKEWAEHEEFFQDTKALEKVPNTKVESEAKEPVQSELKVTSESAEQPNDDKKYEQLIADFKQRGYSDDDIKSRIHGHKIKEMLMVAFIEQKEKEKDKKAADLELTKSELKSVPASAPAPASIPAPAVAAVGAATNEPINKDESKSKTKKRRKKSQMKKKNSQRKTSSSSSIGSAAGGDAGHMDASSELNSVQATASLLTAHSELTTPTTTATGATGAAGAAVAAHKCHDFDIHFFSDTEISTPTSIGASNAPRVGGRPSTPIQSDSELETTMRDKRHVGHDDETSALWKWGELPTPEQAKGSVSAADAQQSERHSMLSNMFSFMKRANRLRKEGAANQAGDIYLSDLDAGMIDPEMAALYFPSPKPKEAKATHSGDEDRESGNGTSLPHSPSSLEENQKSLDSDFDDSKQQLDKKYLDLVSMSMCGMQENGGPPSDEEFDRQLVTYPDVCKNPHMFSSPNLVVRLNGKYYTWMTACPIVMTMIAFQKQLTEDAIEQLISPLSPISPISRDMGDDKPEAVHPTDTVGQTKRSWWSWRRSQDAVPNQANNNIGKSAVKNVNLDKDEKDGDQAAVSTQTSRPNSPDITDPTLSKSDSLVNAENTSALVDNLEELTMTSNKSDEPKERYKKSLRLSSAAIKKLNLKEGMNEIEFSVTTAYQGTTRCKCYLFRWKHNDKVVISDIDGTITKSDVLGHILPMVGKDWAQLGVAQLFSKIEQNGYKLLYLSARAIGQSRVTREYLRSIRQGNVMLPDGPLLLNPTSLISAFHREVIEKKPEQFKIACLSDIRDLFPKRDPFYAGYGNRINDVWAYRAVGIPIMRIFTINTKGELKHELTQTFQSSGYINQSLEVDEYFPPLMHTDEYEYRTDIFDNDDMEDELQFSDDSDIELDDDYNHDNDDDNNDYDDGGALFADDVKKHFYPYHLHKKLEST